MSPRALACFGPILTLLAVSCGQEGPRIEPDGSIRRTVRVYDYKSRRGVAGAHVVLYQKVLGDQGWYRQPLTSGTTNAQGHVTLHIDNATSLPAAWYGFHADKQGYTSSGMETNRWSLLHGRGGWIPLNLAPPQERNEPN